MLLEGYHFNVLGQFQYEFQDKFHQKKIIYQLIFVGIIHNALTLSLSLQPVKYLKPF